MKSSLVGQLKSKGYSIVEDVYTSDEVFELRSILNQYKVSNTSLNREVYAIRDLLGEIPELGKILFNRRLKEIIFRIDPDLFLSKAIYFDKPAESNWYVTWHQDTIVNVKDRKETEGYTGWTKKGKSYGVRPPEEVLHKTFTIRVHLDDTTEENGALKVLPGSHRKILNKEERKLITNHSVATTCEVIGGGVQIMQPLLLHASSKTTNNKRRRVLHLEFNSMELKNGLEWAEKVTI